MVNINKIKAVKNQIQKSNVRNFEMEKYLSRIKEENESFNNKIEIIKLKELVELLRKENNKIPKAKLLIEEYEQALKQRTKEVMMLREYNISLEEKFRKIPRFLRKHL